MPSRTDEPCLPWPIDKTLCPTMNDDGDIALQDKAIMWASTFLWRRSGRKYGVCPVTLYADVCGCGCLPCRCGPKALIQLTNGVPVDHITAIADISGPSPLVIDLTRAQVIDDCYVGLVDGSCAWTVNSCATIKFEFTAGWVPDEEGLAAAAELAEQRYRAWIDVECRSPLLTNALGGYRRGRNGRRDVILTGIPLVDSWLLSQPTGPTGMNDPNDDVVAYTRG